MTCSQCIGIEDIFSREYAAKQLSDYRQNGPHKTTRLMLDAIKKANLKGLTLLDIGGGVGAVQHALIEAGVSAATSVEASQAFLAAAQEETRRRGNTEKIHYHHGNFVDLAAGIEPADIVTLDRVICCYPEVEKLVSLSASKARKIYALVYPIDTWWIKLEQAFENLIYRLQNIPFRVYAHPRALVEELVTSHGLKRMAYQRTLLWQVVVYTR